MCLSLATRDKIYKENNYEEEERSGSLDPVLTISESHIVEMKSEFTCLSKFCARIHMEPLIFPRERVHGVLMKMLYVF